MIEFEFNEKMAKALENMVDPCSFLAVKSYILSPSSEIDRAFIVHGDYKIHEMGSFLVEAKESDDETAQKMFSTGVLKIVVDKSKINAPNPDVLDVNDIPEDDGYNVIYLPPVYLIQPLGRKWA